MTVSRRTLLTLCRVAKRRWSHRHGAWLDPDVVKQHTTVNTRAIFRGCFSDGFGIVLTLWDVPVGDRLVAARLTMESATLAKLLRGEEVDDHHGSDPDPV